MSLWKLHFYNLNHNGYGTLLLSLFIYLCIITTTFIMSLTHLCTPTDDCNTVGFFFFHFETMVNYSYKVLHTKPSNR